MVDPTGCGDAYRAGLLYGLLHGLPWEKTGRIASVMGSLKIESRGTQNHHFTPAQFRQLQFHCGNPPPAADPSTRIFKGSAGAARLRGLTPGLLQRLAMYIVISMPKRKSIACGVSHFMTLLLVGLLTAAMICRQAHLPRAGPGRNQVHHESRLMIFMSRGVLRS